MLSDSNTGLFSKLPRASGRHVFLKGLQPAKALCMTDPGTLPCPHLYRRSSWVASLACSLQPSRIPVLPEGVLFQAASTPFALHSADCRSSAQLPQLQVHDTRGWGLLECRVLNSSSLHENLNTESPRSWGTRMTFRSLQGKVHSSKYQTQGASWKRAQNTRSNIWPAPRRNKNIPDVLC